MLFRAGDTCNAVALIHEGEIELLVDRNGEAIRVGTRGRGTFVGDDEMLGDGVWHRTARALRRTRIEMLARDVYLERFARPSTSPTAAVAAERLVRLLPASPASAAGLPAEGLEIVDFPFLVGRATSEPAASVNRRNTLLLREDRPYHLSRRQFVVLRDTDSIGLTDPGSRLGTFVDGERLSTDPLRLPIGSEAEIRAGGPQSPFRFRLRVE